jgi:hypothetical protein
MLTKDVLRCIVNPLKAQGFRRGRHGVLLRPIRSGFETFIGLNTATHRGDGLVGINPVMGLRDDEVEHLVTELTGHPSIVTLTVSLGYLMPERRYIEWTFGAPKQETADELLYCIRTYGCPAMESLASREAVIDAFKERQNRGPTSLYRQYSLPVAYLLHGDRDSALREIRDELASMSGRTDEAAKLYRLFAQKFERTAEVRSESL